MTAGAPCGAIPVTFTGEGQARVHPNTPAEPVEPNLTGDGAPTSLPGEQTRSALATAVADIAQPGRQSWKTGEFWLVLAPVAVMVLGLFGVHLTVDQATTVLVEVASAVAGAYGIVRTLLKAVHAHAAGQVLQTLVAQVPAEARTVEVALSDPDIARITDAVVARFTPAGRLRQTR